MNTRTDPVTFALGGNAGAAVIIDTSASAIADERQFRLMKLDDNSFRVSSAFDFSSGVSSAAYGHLDLASRFFRLVLSNVYSDGRDRQLSSEIERLVDRLTRSEWYGYQALCHWFLENRHDEESYQLVAEEMDRFLVQKEEEAVSRSFEWREWFCRQFIAAKDYDRLLKWMPDAPLLKKHQSGPMKMAWLLARHHVHGERTPTELDTAWKRFLDKNVPDWIERGSLLDLVVWMKVRYWDGEKVKPDPYDAFLRFWDHLPGIERPPVMR